MLKEAIELVGLAINCKDLFQWVHSAISSRWSQRDGTQEHNLKQDEVLQLESAVNSLSDTLPTAYRYIDRAEWSRHEPSVVELLPKLKDAVYDAEDLLDEFNWYKLKLEVEGSPTQTSPFIDFFMSLTNGSFNKVTDIHKRINNLCSDLDKMGLKLATPPRFDQSVRPETSTGRAEAKIFGREEELRKVIKLLGVPTRSRKRTSNGDPVPTSNQVSASTSGSSEAITSISVLPVVGIGGVGKTTLAQSICNHPRVTSHFDLIIWICVSDDFDVKRLTKEAIESSSGEASAENLNVLQKELGNKVKNRRLLLVLDDVWDDALKENGECWKRFCDPFTNAHCNSMMLVTTRSPQVADRVRTIDAFPLQGLKEDVFWNFFKLCVFGSDISEINPELEDIGKALLPKLKGSPLAAKTLGRLLGGLEPTHWNGILKSELWELKQEKTDILPALELSYIYLPFHLKRCFSFCAAYPKDQTFEGSYLAKIWVAEGFSPALDIGFQYFEELLNRSFFLKVRDKYVIHDLMHDMIQLVTKDECFVIKSEGDFQKVPINVRHLSVLDSKMSPIQLSEKLCNFTKLRTLLCPSSKAVRMDLLCGKLQRIRVFSCASVRELPESIKNMKHLRYLEISLTCHLSSLPSGFCSLYTLQILYAAKCRIESLPSGFSNLINLQQFVSQTLEYHQGQKTNIHVRSADGKEIRLLRDFNQFVGDLSIYFNEQICGDVAADAKLKNKANLNSLTIVRCRDIEVLQVLHPPPNIKSIDIWYYGGVSLPSWFHVRNFQKLTSLEFFGCDRLENISFSRGLQDINNVERQDLPGDNINDIIFTSLVELNIDLCNSLLSLDELLEPVFIPSIKKIRISSCEMLISVQTQRFGELQFLEELEVSKCPKINSQHLFAPSLKFLRLNDPGNLADNIECPSLTKLQLKRLHQTCIQLEKWNLPDLKELEISFCYSLKSIDRSSIVRPFRLLTDLTIAGCKELSTIDHLISHEYLPSIERIHLTSCEELQYLPTERFRSFRFLKQLAVSRCPSLNWHRGVVFPSSLQELALCDCGDFSAWFPSCLENLVSLESLMIYSCKHLVSTPDHLWTRNLKSLQSLLIRDCPDLVSIGGRRAIAKIKNVTIEDCPVLKEPKQPMKRGETIYFHC